METLSTAIPANSSPTVSSTKSTKRRRSVEERRRMVEASLAPGVSITQVAARFGVRPNQLSAWRKWYREGRLGGSESATPKLLPVRLVKGGALRGGQGRGEAAGGGIEVELVRGRVQVSGSADLQALRLVLECLR